MKNCINCGAVLPDEAMFCTTCGTKVDDVFGDTSVLGENDICDMPAYTPEYDSKNTDLFDNVNDTSILGAFDTPDTDVLYESPVQPEPVSVNQGFVQPQPENVNPAFVNPNYQQAQTNPIPVSVNSGAVNSANAYQNGANTLPSTPYSQPSAGSYTNNNYGNYQTSQKTAVEQPTLINCYKKIWKNYANFSGRARRSEYWFVVLANVLISLINIIPYVGQAVSCIYAFAIFVPMLALMVRRLHDIGKEWYYLFFLLIPFAGTIMMLIWFCKDSQVGTNEFGENPKGIN